MSLTEISRVDKSAWMNSLQANSPPGISGGLDAFDGFFLQTSQVLGVLFYDRRLDQLWTKMQGSGLGEVWARVDPVLLTTDYGPISDSKTYIEVKDIFDKGTQDKTGLTYLARKLYLLRLARDFDPKNPELPLAVAQTMHNLLAVSSKLYDQEDIQLLLMQQIQLEMMRQQ